MLHLYEELYVLGIHEEKGTLLSAAEGNLPYGIAGALLSDLALLGRLKMGEKHRLEVDGSGPVEDPFLDETLREIRAAEQPRKIGYWISKLSDEHKKYSKRIAGLLIEKGIVTQEDKRLLWVIPSPSSPEPCGSEKFWVKARLRKLALADHEAQLQDLALLSLVRSCNWLDLVFTKDERKLASHRLYELLLSEAMRNPCAQTIEEIATAVDAVTEED